jgi:hypothetical protein
MTVRRFAPGKMAVAALMVAAIPACLTVRGQEPAPPPAQVIPAGFPHDWSSERLVFSRPDAATAERLKQEPRYLYQQLWRNLKRTLPAGADGALDKRRTRKDWSENLGSGANVGALNYPAKYTFTTATASCSDYVVFNTGVSGSSGVQPTIVAYTNLYSGCGGSVPTVYWEYNTAYPQGSSTGDGSAATGSVVLGRRFAGRFHPEQLKRGCGTRCTEMVQQPRSSGNGRGSQRRPRQLSQL